MPQIVSSQIGLRPHGRLRQSDMLLNHRNSMFINCLFINSQEGRIPPQPRKRLTHHLSEMTSHHHPSIGISTVALKRNLGSYVSGFARKPGNVVTTETHKLPGARHTALFGFRRVGLGGNGSVHLPRLQRQAWSVGARSFPISVLVYTPAVRSNGWASNLGRSRWDRIKHRFRKATFRREWHASL
jgi:hypothetical protein